MSVFRSGLWHGQPVELCSMLHSLEAKAFWPPWRSIRALPEGMDMFMAILEPMEMEPQLALPRFAQRNRRALDTNPCVMRNPVRACDNHGQAHCPHVEKVIQGGH